MAQMPPAPAPAPGYPMSQTQVKYGGFWIRFVASILDAIIIGIPLGIITYLAIQAANYHCVMVPDAAGNPVQVCGSDNPIYVQVAYALIAIVAVVYFAVMWGRGGTFGQKMLGMRVADANTGHPIGIGRGFLRYVGYIISVIPIYIGLMWAGWDSRKQGWHDKIARSVVLRG